MAKLQYEYAIPGRFWHQVLMEGGGERLGGN